MEHNVSDQVAYSTCLWQHEVQYWTNQSLWLSWSSCLLHKLEKATHLFSFELLTGTLNMQQTIIKQYYIYTWNWRSRSEFYSCERTQQSDILAFTWNASYHKKCLWDMIYVHRLHLKTRHVDLSEDSRGTVATSIGNLQLPPAWAAKWSLPATLI